MDNRIIIIGGIAALYLLSQKEVVGDITTGGGYNAGTGIEGDTRASSERMPPSSISSLYQVTSPTSSNRFLTSGGDAVYDTYNQQTVSMTEAQKRYNSANVQNILTPTKYPQSVQTIPMATKKTTPSTTTQQTSIISQLPSFMIGKSIFPKGGI